MIKKSIIYVLVLLGIFSVLSPLAQPSFNVDQEFNLLKNKAKDLNPRVLKLALTAYDRVNDRGLVRNQKLTVVDYSKGSNQPRLWVLDLQNNTVRFKEYVTHGKNSGLNMARSFSNKPGSLKSSIGTFLTRGTYVGREGYSLRLKGLERGVNDNAERRSVIVHGARYASPKVIPNLGRLGRSWGCFAVTLEHIRPLIDAIKGGSVLFAYYPDSGWLKHSRFL